jgi:DNA topoisomerase-1
MGHVRNLPKSEKGAISTVVGVDVHHNYQPTYIILPGKEGLVKNLTSLAENAQKILLATDEDREGEAVAWHLTQVLGQDKEYERVTFTEITPTAITRAIQHSSPTLNENLVQAQETRRILDRLAGYTLSPLLWKKIAPGLSVGRVQSVGMALIVARERERLLFQARNYNDMAAEFFPGDDLNATLVAVDGVPVATGSDFDDSGNLVSFNKRHYTASDIEELKDSLMGGSDGDA